MQPPRLPLPEPLRAAEIPSFTHTSVVKRLPEIARRVLRENALSPEVELMIQDLIREIPHGSIRPLRLPADQAGDWQSWARPYLGMNWLDVPWFFAEEYFYARILAACGYFSPGEGNHKDPYALQKTFGLQSTQPAIDVLAAQVQQALAGPPGPAVLEQLLLENLWGNQNDLSMWPVALSNGAAAETRVVARAHLLSNEIETALAYLSARPGTLRVAFVLDNAGFELATDLALADYLLQSGSAAAIDLHAKSYPVFVSDALPEDILNTLAFLERSTQPATRALAQRLQTALSEGRLRVEQHPFWTSPLPAWEMPGDLEEQIGTAQLLISKGDANYRRLLGDRHWPLETPFAAVVDYFTPAVLALRTLKSEIGVGIPASQVPTNDPNWMINGNWGVIQFSPAHP